jgi:triacylglycerol lipase
MNICAFLCRLSVALLLIGIGHSALAQESAQTTDAAERAAQTSVSKTASAKAAPMNLAAAAAVRTSLWDPPPSSDLSFSTDNGPKLDTGCIYRSEGPIVYTIEIKRFIGELNSDGTLKNADELIGAGLVSPKVKLIMPGFDVDSSAAVSGIAPEVDRVYFNGEPVGILEGVNGDWFLNSFEIDIRKVKFAEAGTDGGEPTGGVNEIRIDIDTANAEENWCTSVDWGNASFRALSPVILIHGNGSNGDFFNRMGFTEGLRAQRIPYDFIQLGAPNFIENNSWEINKQIQSLIRTLGVKQVHIVTHSKGGLDARDYLARYQIHHQKTFKILSMTTLSTPHNGSVLADVAVERHAAAQQVGRLGRVDFTDQFPDYTRQLSALATWEGVDRGRQNLTTGFVAGFNSDNVGRIRNLGITFGTIAADADTNGNAQIDRNPDEYLHLRTESAELTRLDGVTVPFTGQPIGQQTTRYIVDSLYQILRRSAGVRVTYHREGIWPARIRVATIHSIDNPTPLGNDTLVTIPSARGEGFFQPLTRNSFTFQGGAGRNHSNVANRGVAETVIPWMIEAERRSGGLK